jgi:uncharacterized membrane protein
MAEKITHTAYDDAPLSAAHHLDTTGVNEQEGLQARKGDHLIGRTVTINRPRQELYEFWRDLRNLPLFMENIRSITVTDGNRSHWIVEAPGDRVVEWDSIITGDQPGSLLAWESVDGASVRNSGRIEFRDSTNGRGTIVTATIVYHPPAGSAGKAIAKLFEKEPHIQVRRDLRRFKQLMEAGEVATSTPPNPPPNA